jgi:hypothetical protein
MKYLPLVMLDHLPFQFELEKPHLAYFSVDEARSEVKVTSKQTYDTKEFP